MNFDFLAEGAAETSGKRWQVLAQLALAQAARIRDPEAFIRSELAGVELGDRDLQKEIKGAREAKDPVTILRRFFLHRHFVDRDGSGVGQGAAVAKRCDGVAEHRAAALRETLPDLAHLPQRSALLRLGFTLTTPLLTRDDAPFYLFDNPARKDHVFSVPHLAAGSLKGLLADAYRHAFPGDQALHGKDAAAKTAAFRRGDGSALRLFGLASDGSETPAAEEALPSSSGRLHCTPVWFEHIQYLLLNPKDRATGMGTVPIQFEAIAPMTQDGKPVRGELAFFYANPAAAAEADEATVRRDLARLVMACAAWLPQLGLGAKRRAGYGGIVPIEAQCQARGWTQKWPRDLALRGEDSWRERALKIAEGA